MAARRIGIRELREDLSKIVRRVERGEVVEVTDRGRPIARIVPAGPAGGALADLIAQGKVIPAREHGALPRPIDRASRMTTEEALEILRAER
jgi:prevent-host-death family protein